MSHKQQLDLPSDAGPARRHATTLRKAFAAAAACLVVLAIDLAACRTAEAGDAVAGPAESREIACARDGQPSVAERAFAPQDRAAQAVSLDVAAADIPVWKAVTLGTHGSADALRAALVTSGCGIGALASEALDRPGFTLGKAKTRVDLVALSAADLGVDGESASLAEIHRRALRRGLALCAPEVAPQLRLQYPDQPPGELLHVAMRPIATPGGDAVGFIVGNGGAGLFLIGADARPDRVVSSTARFVFVRPPIS